MTIHISNRQVKAEVYPGFSLPREKKREVHARLKVSGVHLRKAFPCTDSGWAAARAFSEKQQADLVKAGFNLNDLTIYCDETLSMGF